MNIWFLHNYLLTAIRVWRTLLFVQGHCLSYSPTRKKWLHMGVSSGRKRL